MKLNTNTILIILGTLVIAAGAYWYFSSGTGNDLPLTTTTVENQAQAQFQLLSGQLPTSFDTSIFSNPSFRVLIDLATPITPESSGRLDPFATIVGVSSTQ